MKRCDVGKIILIFLLVCFVLTGCSSTPPSNVDATTSTESTENSTQTTSTQTAQEEVDNSQTQSITTQSKTESTQQEDNSQINQNENGYLTQVGQRATTSDGSIVELMKIINANQTIYIAPIKVKIKTIKILKYTKTPEETKRVLENFFGKQIPEPYYFLQIRYDVENTVNAKVEFFGIGRIYLSDGEVINAVQDNLLSMATGYNPMFYGMMPEKEWMAGFVIDGKPENIDSITLTFSPTFDGDTKVIITPEQQIEYYFN